MIHNIKSYVGRSAVYIESSKACAATVVSADSNAQWNTAAFRLLPGAFMCRLRFLRTPDDGPIEEVLEQAPFGNEWQVEVSDQEFFLDDDHWQASFLWGGGFRIFFQPSFVSRFLSGDVSWLDEFYADDIDGDDGDDSDGLPVEQRLQRLLRSRHASDAMERRFARRGTFSDCLTRPAPAASKRTTIWILDAPRRRPKRPPTVKDQPP
jgi:hypothetical protein